jgi:hypothetical protein
VRACGEEFCQPFLRERNRVRPGDANNVEAVFVRRRDQIGLERGRIVQKSRLA